MESIIVYYVADRLMSAWFDNLDELKKYPQQYARKYAVALADAKVAVEAYEQYFRDDMK